jgi:hypothetical protein
MYDGICTPAPRVDKPTINFIVTCAVLLLLNSLWLVVMIRSGHTHRSPESLWAKNNSFCAVLLATDVVLCELYQIKSEYALHQIKSEYAILAAALILVLNTLCDLWNTRGVYVMGGVGGGG